MHHGHRGFWPIAPGPKQMCHAPHTRQLQIRLDTDRYRSSGFPPANSERRQSFPPRGRRCFLHRERAPDPGVRPARHYPPCPRGLVRGTEKNPGIQQGRKILGTGTIGYGHKANVIVGRRLRDIPPAFRHADQKTGLTLPANGGPIRIGRHGDAVRDTNFGRIFLARHKHRAGCEGSRLNSQQEAHYRQDSFSHQHDVSSCATRLLHRMKQGVNVLIRPDSPGNRKGPLLPESLYSCPVRRGLPRNHLRKAITATISAVWATIVAIIHFRISCLVSASSLRTP